MNTLEMVIFKIEKILAENEIEGKIHKDTALMSDFAIDSVIAIEILVSMEETFGITINDDDLSLELLESPLVLSKYIEELLRKK